MRLGHVAADFFLVQVGRVDVHARARLHHVGNDQADHQGQGGKGQKVRHGLAEHAAHGAELRHARDAGHDGQKDHRRDDHLDQLDEGIAEGLHGSAVGGLEMAQQNPEDDGDHHLKIQLPIKRQPHGMVSGGGNGVHGGLQKSRGTAPPGCVEGAVCTAARRLSR
ncbi:hypothetical protein D3C72_1495040 [compost metagenome]